MRRMKTKTPGLLKYVFAKDDWHYGIDESSKRIGEYVWKAATRIEAGTDAHTDKLLVAGFITDMVAAYYDGHPNKTKTGAPNPLQSKADWLRDLADSVDNWDDNRPEGLDVLESVFDWYNKFRKE
jgi:hypothetical protein